MNWCWCMYIHCITNLDHPYYLEAKDYCPNQTKCESCISINNVLSTNVFQMNLKHYNGFSSLEPFDRIVSINWSSQFTHCLHFNINVPFVISETAKLSQRFPSYEFSSFLWLVFPSKIMWIILIYLSFVHQALEAALHLRSFHQREFPKAWWVCAHLSSLGTTH